MTTYSFSETLKSISKGRSRTLISVTTVSIALLIFSGFLLISHNLTLNIDRFRAGTKIDVILNEKADAVKISENIKTISEVKDVKIYSKIETLSYFKQNLGPELAKGLTDAFGDNPLFAFLEVSLREKTTEPEKITSRIKEINGVNEVLYGKSTVRRLSKIASVLKIISLVSGIVMSLFILLIMLNSIRTTVHTRKDEIYILKLIGASDNFVRMPFVFEGILISILGSVIGIGLMYIAFIKLQSHIDFVYLEFIPPEIIFSVIIFSAALGALGGVIAVRESIKGMV